MATVMAVRASLSFLLYFTDTSFHIRVLFLTEVSLICTITLNIQTNKSADLSGRLRRQALGLASPRLASLPTGKEA